MKNVLGHCKPNRSFQEEMQSLQKSRESEL